MKVTAGRTLGNSMRMNRGLSKAKDSDNPGNFKGRNFRFLSGPCDRHLADDTRRAAPWLPLPLSTPVAQLLVRRVQNAPATPPSPHRRNQSQFQGENTAVMGNFLRGMLLSIW